MASLDDILTTQKNGVVGVNAIVEALLASVPTTTSLSVDAETLIAQGNGRLLSFNVVEAGSSVGMIYNSSANAGPYADSDILSACSNQIGVVNCNQIFTNGLVISPGTGQRINVTYRLGI